MLLTVKQAAKRLGVTPHTVYNRINDGSLKIMEKPEDCRYGMFIEEAELERFSRLPRPKPGPKRRCD